MCMATYCVSSNLCYFPRSRVGEGRVRVKGGAIAERGREGGRDEREGWAGVGWVSEWGCRWWGGVVWLRLVRSMGVWISGDFLGGGRM